MWGTSTWIDILDLIIGNVSMMAAPVCRNEVVSADMDQYFKRRDSADVKNSK